MQKSQQKICFIMQHVTPGTHMDYVYEMARTLREDRGLPITLLIEKHSPVPVPSWAIVQKFKLVPLRVLENIFLIVRARLQGTKIFYVHYSFLSAITAGLVTQLFGGQVYYWNAGMPWLYKRSWRDEWYQKLAYQLITKLVTGASALKPGYEKLYGLKPEQFVIITNWIDTKNIVRDTSISVAVRTELGIPPQVPVLLFVHKLAQRKGAHFLPEVMSKLMQTDAHMIVAGDGPLRGQLEEEIVKRNLQERVHLLGYVTRSRVSQLYQAADIFIMPSEEEGSPHSLLEAMAYGLPFVAFDVGGVSETATEALRHLIVPYGDIPALCGVVEHLMQDHVFYEATVATESKVLPKYKKEVVVQEFYRLLTE